MKRARDVIIIRRSALLWGLILIALAGAALACNFSPRLVGQITPTPSLPPSSTPLPPPEPPSNLTVTRQGARTLLLSWVDNSDNEDGFMVWRALPGRTSLLRSWDARRRTPPASATARLSATGVICTM
ncbi:MAG TPA: hypothetical protein ENI95_07615 [Chloroflexi bacterium]|nr:hypothetical protein [Chloroflexota bacterium]